MRLSEWAERWMKRHGPVWTQQPPTFATSTTRARGLCALITTIYVRQRSCLKSAFAFVSFCHFLARLSCVVMCPTYDMRTQDVNLGVRHIYHDPENLWDVPHFAAEFADDNLEWPEQ